GRGVVRPRWTPGARVVPGTGPLHLDHPRAQVGERHGGQRTREHTAEVGDEDPVERSPDGTIHALSVASRSLGQKYQLPPQRYREGITTSGPRAPPAGRAQGSDPHGARRAAPRPGRAPGRAAGTPRRARESPR